MDSSDSVRPLLAMPSLQEYVCQASYAPERKQQVSVWLGRWLVLLLVLLEAKHMFIVPHVHTRLVTFGNQLWASRAHTHTHTHTCDSGTASDDLPQRT